MSFLGDALDSARTDFGSKKRHLKRDLVEKKEPISKWNKKQKYNLNEAQSAATRLNEYDRIRSQKALEEKAKRYKEMYKKGMNQSLSEDAPLIDFDRKWAEGHRISSASEDEDGSEDEEVNEPPKIIRGPHLQSFQPDEEKKDEIWREANRSLETHYDPAFELRHRGAGYINLGLDADVRKDRLHGLSKERQETKVEREKRGFDEVADTRPNDVDARHREVGEAFLDSLF